MGVVGYKAHKKAEEGRAWDGAGARKRLLEWAGGPDKDKVDWAKYSQGFAWVDSENKENVGAYKLPHSDIIDGAICDVWGGVAAAMGALLGARGGADIPGGDRKGVYNHLKSHYTQWDKEAPEFRAEPEAEPGLTTVRAGLVMAGSPEMEQALRLINTKFAHKELGADEVYLLPPAELSNMNLDSYFTRMAQSSLQNYMADAVSGVPLMNSHRRFLPAPELPLGQSYNAVLEEGQDNLRLVAFFYMLRGLELNGHKTNDIIRTIEGGTTRDLSIGYDGGWYKCGLCGKNLLSPMEILFGFGEDDADSCEHVPGVKYDGKVASAWVEDARLVEGSLVYSGATPGAVLRKARWAASTGRLARGEASVLEDRWGVRIQNVGTFWMERAEQREVVEMTKEEVLRLVEAKAPKLVDQVKAADEPVGALLEAWLAEATEQDETARVREAQLGDLQKRVDLAEKVLPELQKRLAQVEIELTAAQERVAQQIPLVHDGQAYRTDLVEQAVAARVRAQGDAFDAESYCKVLQAQPLAYIRGEIAAWDKATQAVFEPGRPVGAVLAREQDKGGKQQPKAPGRPARAYKA